jgi:hypothetical protein
MSNDPLVQTTNPDQILNLSYPYEIEISQSKSGSNHVYIVKSLKIRGDSASEVVEETGKALNVLKTYLDALNQM